MFTLHRWNVTDRLEESPVVEPVHPIPGLNNWLSLTENREPGATRSVERMVELVLRGLQRLYAPAPQEPTPEA